MQPAAVQKHAGEDRRPGRDRAEPRRQFAITEQHRRDHAVAVDNGLLRLPELPQPGAEAHADQPVGDDRRLPDRIVVIQRQGEDHGLAHAEREPLSLWEREGPIAQRWEREGLYAPGTLTRLRALALRHPLPEGEGFVVHAQDPTRPSWGLDGSAKSRSGMRPASRARRPPSTACRIAAAMRRGSCDLAIAVLTKTAS